MVRMSAQLREWLSYVENAWATVAVSFSWRLGECNSNYSFMVNKNLHRLKTPHLQWFAWDFFSKFRSAFFGTSEICAISLQETPPSTRLVSIQDEFSQRCESPFLGSVFTIRIRSTSRNPTWLKSRYGVIPLSTEMSDSDRPKVKSFPILSGCLQIGPSIHRLIPNRIRQQCRELIKTKKKGQQTNTKNWTRKMITTKSGSCWISKKLSQKKKELSARNRREKMKRPDLAIGIEISTRWREAAFARWKRPLPIFPQCFWIAIRWKKNEWTIWTRKEYRGIEYWVENVHLGRIPKRNESGSSKRKEMYSERSVSPFQKYKIELEWRITGWRIKDIKRLLSSPKRVTIQELNGDLMVIANTYCMQLTQSFRAMVERIHDWLASFIKRMAFWENFLVIMKGISSRADWTIELCFDAQISLFLSNRIKYWLALNNLQMLWLQETLDFRAVPWKGNISNPWISVWIMIR
jgi:hypothetical protein